MGMTPLEGLMMGTRSGDVDPAPWRDCRGNPADPQRPGSGSQITASGLLGISGLFLRPAGAGAGVA